MANHSASIDSCGAMIPVQKYFRVGDRSSQPKIFEFWRECTAFIRVVEPVAPSISEDSQLLSAGESSIGF